MGGFDKASNASATYAQKAGEARTRGIQQQAEAIQKAYSLEYEASRNGLIAMQNMAAMRENQASAVGAARNAAAASGFAVDTGSQRKNQEVIATTWERHIANANKSNVIADENARYQANMYRRYGNTAMTMANIEADYYSKLSSAYSKSKWWALLGDTLPYAMQGLIAFGGGSSSSGGASGGA